MIIGLTGGIASGKSTAARYLRDHGAYLIDADLLGHRAYEPGTQAHAQIVETFGEAVVGADGSIDRKALGGKVFGAPDALKQLTDIVWPAIRTLADAEIAAARAEAPERPIVLEAAVLFEAGWEGAVDEVWVVTVDPDTAVARASARDGIDAVAVQRRIDAQLSNEARVARADVVIENTGAETAMRAALDRQWSRIRPGGDKGRPRAGSETS